MRILLTNNHLARMGGTETWVLTMARHLAKEHEVGIFTHNKGYVSDLLSDYIDDDPTGYDVALINHSSCIDVDAKKKIFTSHGVIPKLEQPVKGADEYVAVSEEVQANLKSQGFDSTIIRNPIDTERFKPVEYPVSLKKALFMSNHQGEAREVIRSACRELGIELTVYGGRDQTRDPSEAINAVDLVFGLGRTAYEAMACGRNVVVYDYNGGDGLVTADNVFDFRHNNCSGRYNGNQYTVDELIEEIEKFEPGHGPKLRSYADNYHSVDKIANQYLIE